MNTAIVETEQLCYSYSKDARILSDINLSVEKGSIYGFLGPNGSGKTTTLSLILGLLYGHEGSIRIFGEELSKNRTGILRRIGSLIETPSLYAHLTAAENLEVYRRVYDVPKERINQVLHLVDLEDTGKKTVKKFSLGMKQRLSVALSLLPSPELLILDEPTNGLDPNGIIQLRKLIKRLNKEHGITVLVSSHILAEVEKMVTHLGIISKGKLIFQGKLEELQGVEKDISLSVQTSDNVRAAKLLQQHKPFPAGETLSLTLENTHQIADINRLLVKNDLDVFLLQPKTRNLEQLFIDLTA